jgi:hypothetical protein
MKKRGIHPRPRPVVKRPRAAHVVPWKPQAPPATPNETIRELAILGGVLIDGHRSAIQPHLTQTEAWKQILDGMARAGANAQEVLK